MNRILVDKDGDGLFEFYRWLRILKLFCGCIGNYLKKKTNMNICNFFLADNILGSFFPPHNDENCTILQEHFQEYAMYNWEFFAQNSSTPSVCMSSQT